MATDPAPDKQVAAFITACRRVAEHGLVRCSSGNLSQRLDDERMLISASRAWLGEITGQQVALCRIKDAVSLNSVKPSAEVGFHAGILSARTDVNIVLHFQTPAATAIACRDPDKVDYFVLPEIPYYIGDVASVPYMNPGTPELAEAVVKAAAGHDMVMLRNHGQVTVGKDAEDAIQKAVFFELACDIILRGEGQPQPISTDHVKYIYRKANDTGEGGSTR